MSSAAPPLHDAESRDWVERLGPASPARDDAARELHTLLLGATRFELRRRGRGVAGDRDDLAHQAADDALVAILAKLDRFRGESRFTTWAYKFALYEAAVKARRHSWDGRQIPLDAEAPPIVAQSGPSPHDDAETRELLGALQEAISADLSPHQREVLVAITLNGVPIDVLADRLGTTRGALYKTLHDARRKLRRALAARGLDAGGETR